MKREYRVINVSILFAILIWIAHAALETIFIHDEPFLGLLLTDVPAHDVYARIVSSVSVIIFGVLISRAFTARRKAEAALRSSEELFQSLVDNLVDGVIIIDWKGMILFANNSAARLVGIDNPAEGVGKNAIDFIHPSYKKAALKDIIQLKIGEVVFEKEYMIRRTLGGEKWVEVNGIKIDYMGSVRALISLRDITERRMAEDALRDSEEKFRSVADTAIDSIVTVDSDGKIVFLNNAARSLFGYSFNEVEGKSFSVIISGARSSKDKDFIKDLIGARGVKQVGKNIETEGLNKKGKKFPIELTLSEWESNGEKFNTAIIRDITIRKQVDDAVKRQVEELKRIDEAKTEFISIAGHELRTPLQSIILANDMLLNADVLPKQGKYLNLIREDSLLLRRLIKDLLDLSAIHLGKIEFNIQKIDVKELIEYVKKDALLKADEKSITVRYTVSKDVQNVYVDVDRIRQVFSNLLVNAIKYTPRNGKVNVTIKKMKDEILVNIKDTGIGVPKEFRDKIFEKFTQADPMMKLKEGFGLGLAISKEILQAQGGNIWIDETSRKGSTFCFTIPTKEVKKR